MPGARTGHGPVIFHAYKENSAAAVGEAHHRLDEITVIQPFPLLTLELHLVGFTCCGPAGDARRQVLCRVRHGHHGRLLIRTLYAALPA
jgi:hypothetical protein